MKNCPHCGTGLPDDAEVCTNCGAPQPYFEISEQEKVTEDNEMKKSVLTEVKSVCASRWFFAAAFTYTAAAIFDLINAFLPSSFLIPLLSGADDTAYAPYTISSGIGNAEPTVIGLIYSAVTIVASLLPVVTAVGLWLTYMSAAKSRGEDMKLTGINTVRVSVMTSYGAICIRITVLEIMAFLSLKNLSAGSYVGDALLSVYLFALMIGLTAALPFIIVYYIKLIKTINTIGQTIATGIPSDKISTFVAVLMIIMGGSSAISAITNLTAFNALVFVSELCRTVSFIAFGMMLFAYRGKMRAIMNGF